jgi:hypothetical protein
VVYVVVPSDSAAEVLHALHAVAQALAPCSSLGLAEVAAQLQGGHCATSAEDANATAGGTPDLYACNCVINLMCVYSCVMIADSLAGNITVTTDNTCRHTLILLIKIL